MTHQVHPAAVAAAEKIGEFFSPCKTARKYDARDVTPIISDAITAALSAPPSGTATADALYSALISCVAAMRADCSRAVRDAIAEADEAMALYRHEKDAPSPVVLGETPRTDAAIKAVDVAFVGHDGLSSSPEQFVEPDFARQLERELATERNLHGQTRTVVEELNIICNDLRNAGQPQLIRSEAIRLLRENKADMEGQLTALREQVRALEEDKADLDWLEEWHLSLSRLTSPDMSGLRFVGQYFNPAKMRGEAGPSYLRIEGATIRKAIRAARAARPASGGEGSP